MLRKLISDIKKISGGYVKTQHYNGDEPLKD